MAKFTTECSLCKCNNCETIMIDQNPQVNAKVYKVNVNKVWEMKDIRDSFGEISWSCPNCETDKYFTDNIDEEEIKKIGIIE